MELEFRELEFHKKRHYRAPWNTAIGKTLFKKKLHETRVQ